MPASLELGAQAKRACGMSHQESIILTRAAASSRRVPLAIVLCFAAKRRRRATRVELARIES